MRWLLLAHSGITSQQQSSLALTLPHIISYDNEEIVWDGWQTAGNRNIALRISVEQQKDNFNSLKRDLVKSL